MIFYNIKLIISSIILGTLALFYKDYPDGLYKNINYKNNVLGTIKFRTLSEFSHGHTTNHKHENDKLREYRNTKEAKYKNNKYPDDKTKTKQKIPQITNKKFPGTPNLKKYKKKTYHKDKEANSKISPRSLKNLEMQRKLYNDFDVKQEMHFQNISDQLKDSYESRTNKCLHHIFAVITYLIFWAIVFYKLYKTIKNNTRKN
ncbi:stevor PIR protein, putative [Plasmodium gaboni]|uniref:Stevor PIR protein, putative n=1 Tax=Plasmodium gaboni TaxID=647221 RepID=A0ABY0KXG3_9APIC|nr:stevor PIR protein, putative [Plasmodium gaboni]